MVKICQTGLLKLNFETRPKKRIFRFLPKISAGHGWSRKFFLAIFQILGPLGCQGWVVIPQNVKKKSKSLHPNVHFLRAWGEFLCHLTQLGKSSGSSIEFRFTWIPHPPSLSAISMLVFKRLPPLIRWPSGYDTQKGQREKLRSVLLFHHLDNGDTARSPLNPRLSWALWPGTLENWDGEILSSSSYRTVRRTSHGNATSNTKILAITR